MPHSTILALNENWVIKLGTEIIDRARIVKVEGDGGGVGN